MDRPDISHHLGFAAGPHRCLGMHLARHELVIALQEWHKRIPDYAIAAGVSDSVRVAPGLGLALHRQKSQVPVVGAELVARLVLVGEEATIRGIDDCRWATGTVAGTGADPPDAGSCAAAPGRSWRAPASSDSTVMARADRGSVRATTSAEAARARAWCAFRAAMSSGVSWNICHQPMPATTTKAGHSTE